jgi:tetratricopeptide (TPR) repeat protein
MKVVICVLIALGLCGSLAAQQHSMHNQSTAKKATLMTGLGDLHHPVSTSNAEAQKFFDQGMRLIYAFNHQEAAGSFERAAELDPKMAMAYWGLAEAVGPNYNDPADPDRYKKAHEAIAKAESLAANA